MYIYISMRVVPEEEFLIFLIDTAKPIINISNRITKHKNQKILYN